MLKDIKNVVFDLGGVICDLEIDRVIEAFREIGMPKMAALMDPCYPAEVNERMESGKISWAEACDEMRAIDNRPEVTDAQIEWVYREFLSRVDAEKMAVIDRLRARGIRTYVLSNTNPTAIEIVRDRVREATGRELESYFDAQYLSFRLGILKPSPVLVSSRYLSKPQPYRVAQKSTKISAPPGRRRLLTMKSSLSSTPRLPMMVMPLRRLSPRAQGMLPRKTMTKLMRTAFLRAQPKLSMQEASRFSNTAITVVKLAKVINRKNSVPHS